MALADQHGLHGFEQLLFAVGFGQVAGKARGLQSFGFAGLGPQVQQFLAAVANTLWQCRLQCSSWRRCKS